MKKINLGEVVSLPDKLFLDTKELAIEAFSTRSKKDINGLSFDVKDSSSTYLQVTKIEGMVLFIREDILLEAIMEPYLENLRDGSIYDHGYPESRLVPQDHREDCRETFGNGALNEISNKLEEILDNIIAKEG